MVFKEPDTQPTRHPTNPAPSKDRSTMKVGNVSQTVWKRSVSKQLHTTRESVIFSPAWEERCSAVRVENGNVTLSASATVSGGTADIGMYAAAAALNELAVHSAEPVSLSVQVLLPPSVREIELKSIAGHVEAICKQAAVQITAFKAEVNPAILKTIVFVTAQGEAKEEELIQAGNAIPGQEIVLCGYAGLEGMLRILSEREKELSQRFVPAFIQQMKSLSGSILSLDAVKAAKDAGVSAMHQVGSGGIFAGLWELAEAAGIGLEIALSQIAIKQETIELCEFYNLNPYQMTSAGCILMTTNDGDALVKALERGGARAGKLGIATDQSARVITSGEDIRYIDRPAPDEWMRWQELNIIK